MNKNFTNYRFLVAGMIIGIISQFILSRLQLDFLVELLILIVISLIGFIALSRLGNDDKKHK